MVPGTDARHSRTDRLDDAGGFVAQEVREEPILPPGAPHLKQLRVADAGGGDSDPDLALGGLRRTHVLHGQRRLQGAQHGRFDHSAINQ